MKIITKTLIAGGLACAALALSGTSVAIAENRANNQAESLRNLGYAPEITIDFETYSEDDVPNAVNGEVYRLFSAEAEDVYGEKLPVTTKVYLHYYEDTKNLITVKNHTVTPTYYGVYTVEYTATDVFGNVGKRTYDFACEDKEALQVVLNVTAQTTITGVETEIATCTYQNAIGNVTNKITATHEIGGTYDLTGKTSFIPTYEGEYIVQYTFSDYNTTVTESYVLSVGKNESPVFLDRASMPKYFIVGKEYTLPTVQAYQFITGKPAKITPVITVKQDKQKEKTLSGYTFVPEAEGEVEIIYTISCNGNKQSQSYSARVVDVGVIGETFDVTKYFYSEDSLVFANDTVLTLTTGTNFGRVDFINPLCSRNVSVSLSTEIKTTNFSAVNVYLTDSLDESVQLKINYSAPKTEDSLLTVEGSGKYRTYKVESEVQEIAYDDSKKQVSFNGAVSLDCPADFEGFPSGQIYLSFEFCDVVGESELKIYSINNQVLYKTLSDNYKPEMWYEKNSRTSFSINEVVAIPYVQYGDVLDKDVSFRVSVIDPNGNFVVSQEGILLNNYTGGTENCTVLLSEYGNYVVRFTVEDSSENSLTYNFEYAVIDFNGPSVVLKDGQPPKNLKVGESFVVSDVIISDDVSSAENCKVFIVLLGPKGDVKQLTVNRSYSLQDKGVYYLRYRVTDEAGNATTRSYTIVVE